MESAPHGGGVQQLPELTGGAQWTIATAPDYLASRANDPWADYWASKQTLVKAAKVLGLSLKTRAGARIP